MTIHTPGPWTCTPSRSNDAHYSVYDADGNWLTINEDIHEANARLIASAPDMAERIKELEAQRAELLSVLAAIIDQQDTMGFDGSPDDDLIAAARAVIAKARGE